MKSSFVGIVILGLFTTVAAAPTHIPTWAYDEYRAQGTNATPQQVRRYVTYAEGGLGNDKALLDCGDRPGPCRSVWYFDPHLIYDSPACPYHPDQSFIDAASENWYVHDAGFSDSNHRVHGTYKQSCHKQSVSIAVYVANVANPAVQAYFRDYLQRNADLWDYYLDDDTGATLVNQMYGPGGGFCRGLSLTGWCNTTEEFADDTALLRAQGEFADAMRHANGSPMELFINGESAVLSSSQRYVGVVLENTVVDDGTLKPNAYERVLAQMSQTEARLNGVFVILSTGNAQSGSPSQIMQRTVTTAVAWLGFRDGKTVVWPDLEFGTDNLAVWPEDMIYPTRPLESMDHGPSDLEVSPGVWRREFGACYDNGRHVGGCAVLLNANPTPVAIGRQWLREPYRHVMHLTGGDVLDGGALSLSDITFAAGQTEIPGGGAVLLIQ